MTRIFCQLLGVLFVVGFMLKYWLAIALVVAVVVVVRRAPGWWAAHEAAVAAEEARLAGIAARADQQHNLVLQGDDRGVYGQYPPKEWTWAEDALTAMREGVRGATLSARKGTP